MRVKRKFSVPCELEVDEVGKIVGVYPDREWLADCVVIDVDGQAYIELPTTPIPDGAREAYFAHKKEHPTGTEKLTGLQRRMQSGGA